MDELASQARDFAIRLHGGQRYGRHPYAVHLDQVADVLRDFGFKDSVTGAAAYLHDVLEDTALRVHGYGTLKARFGTEVADVVVAVTDGQGDSREERHRCLPAKIRYVGALALAVKLADRLANARNSLLGSSTRSRARFLMYRQEYPWFRASLEAIRAPLDPDRPPVWRQDALDTNARLDALWSALDAVFAKEI